MPGTLQVEWLALGATDPGSGLDEALRSVADATHTLVFLCHGGRRSDAATSASAAAGFGRALNALGGVGGEVDAMGRRSNLGGWRKAGLSWVMG
jgi:rhodanese-related sulfurtransferase